jgi:ParB/RepB/Spo0J family partition protein
MSEIILIEKEKLIIADYNPRIARNQEKIRALAENIKHAGIAIPLVVRPTNDGKFEIIDGGERFLAGQIVGIDKYPCIIKNIPLSEAKKLALAVNVEREELTDEEIAMCIRDLIEEGVFKSKKEAAIFLGWSENYLNEKLKELDEIKDKTIAKQLVTEYPGLNIKVAETLASLGIKPSKEDIEIIKMIPKAEQKTILDKLQETGDIKKAIAKYQKEQEEEIAKPIRIRAPSGYSYEVSKSDSKLIIFKLERGTIIQQLTLPLSDLKQVIEAVRKFLDF